MGRKLLTAIIASSIASIVGGYATGEPLEAFILAGLAAAVAETPRLSMLAACIGVISWYIVGLILASGANGPKLLEITSQIAGMPITIFYIVPLLLGLIISTLLAYGLASIVFKR